MCRGVHAGATARLKNLPFYGTRTSHFTCALLAPPNSGALRSLQVDGEVVIVIAGTRRIAASVAIAHLVVSVDMLIT